MMKSAGMMTSLKNVDYVGVSCDDQGHITENVSSAIGEIPRDVEWWSLLLCQTLIWMVPKSPLFRERILGQAVCCWLRICLRN